MIQSRWSEQQSSEFTGAASNGLSNSARALIRHSRDSKFTSRIIRHGGPAKSQSMDASARAKKHEKSVLRKSSNSVDALTADFEREAASLVLLHQKFLRDQQLLEFEAKKFFAARTIQQMYRKRKAQKILARLMARRFLSLFIFFRRYFKRRVEAVKKLQRAVRTYRIKKAYHISVSTIRAAKRIQRKYRAFRIRRSTSTFMVRCAVMKQMMRHVLLFGTRKAYHQIKQMRFIIAHGKERVAVRNLISAWRRKRRAQVFSGPNGKQVYLTLAYLNTTIEYIYNPFYSKRRQHLITSAPSAETESGISGAAVGTPATPEIEHFAPPPTPNEPHYSNMIIDYIKHKVEIQHAIEQQTRRKHQGGRHLYPKRNLHVRGKVVMLPTNSIEQSALANVLTGEKMVYAQDNHRHFSKEEIARLGYGGKLITPMYTRDQLPDELIGIWGPKTFADVIMMIVDMKRIAVANPNLVDDGSLFGTAASPIVSRMSGKFKRREHNGRMYIVNQNGEMVGEDVNRVSSPSSALHRDSNMSTASSTSTNMSVTPSHRGALNSAGSKNGSGKVNHFPFPEEDIVAGGKPPVGGRSGSAKNGKLQTPKRGTPVAASASAAAGGKKPGSASNKKQPATKGAGLPSETSTAANGKKQINTIHEEDHREETKAMTAAGVGAVSGGVSSLRISTEITPEDLMVTLPQSENLLLTPLSAAFKQTFGFLNSASSSFLSVDGSEHPPAVSVGAELEVPEVELQLPTAKSLKFANDFVMKARTTTLMLKMINNAHAPSSTATTAQRSATNDAAAEATKSFFTQARSSLVLVKPGSASLSTGPSFMTARTITSKASDVTGSILRAARNTVTQSTLQQRRQQEPPAAPSLEAIAATFTTVKNKAISFSSSDAAADLASGVITKARSSVVMMPKTPPGVRPANVTKKAAAFSMAPTVTLESLAAAAAAPISEQKEEEGTVERSQFVVGSELEGNSVVELPLKELSSEYSMTFEEVLGSLVDEPDFNIQLENSDFAIQMDSPVIDHLKPPAGRGHGHKANAYGTHGAHQPVGGLPHIKQTTSMASAATHHVGSSGNNSRPTSSNMATHFTDIPLSDDEGDHHSHAHFKPARPVSSHATGDARSRPGRKIV